MTRSSQSAAPTGRMRTAARKYGSTIAAMTIVTAATLRRTMRADGEGEDGGDGDQRRRADDHAHLGRPRLGEHCDAARARDSGADDRPRRRRATSPATNATAPITIALAASTRPRRGLAASVVRIRPRRYSAVMNIVATTATAISPTNVPSR